VIFLNSEQGKDAERRFFLIPRAIADKRDPRKKIKVPDNKYWTHQTFPTVFADFENNFTLSPTGSGKGDA